ncbi:MAG: H-X9-DG-CTERM domain-containing protein, partial [Planctomycetota bacterium]
GKGGFYSNLIPASYSCGDAANFAFADGHVESLAVRDILLTPENFARRDDPSTQASLRRWNVDADPHTEVWSGDVNLD